jgi:hypothetical protein
MTKNAGDPRRYGSGVRDDDLGEARAIQTCLRHLMREACDLNLDLTARVLVAAMEAVDTDLSQARN